MRFKKGQPTDTQKSGHERSHYLAVLRPREVKIRTRTTTLPRCATPTRGNKLDGVPRTQTSRLLLSYYSSRSHGTVCTTTCKGRNYCRSRDPASWQKNGHSMSDDCERTATVALPTAASPGLVPTTTAPLPHLTRSRLFLSRR